MRGRPPAARFHLIVALALALVLGATACAGGTSAAKPKPKPKLTTTADAGGGTTTSTITVAEREKWNRTANEWFTLAATTSEVTQSEADFMAKHNADLGPTTNAAQMLVFGYDLCEQFLTSGKPRDQVVQEWAAANPAMASLAPALGADATRLLCP